MIPEGRLGAVNATLAELLTQRCDAPHRRCAPNRQPSPSAYFVVQACAAYTRSVQYTIRGIPSAVDAALRLRARASGKSLNEAAVDALTAAAGMAGKRRKRRDLADVAGTWKTDKATESALAAQDLVGPDQSR